MNRAVRSLLIECPDYTGPVPDTSFMQEAHKKLYEHKQKQQRSPLLDTLQEALGGPLFVASGLLTRHGHYIGMPCYNLCV